ncbi:hypothetical protein Trydic_g3969 [Trypoxylus dichotomus]
MASRVALLIVYLHRLTGARLLIKPPGVTLTRMTYDPIHLDSSLQKQYTVETSYGIINVERRVLEATLIRSASFSEARTRYSTVFFVAARSKGGRDANAISLRRDKRTRDHPLELRMCVYAYNDYIRLGFIQRFPLYKRRRIRMHLF